MRSLVCTLFVVFLAACAGNGLGPPGPDAGTDAGTDGGGTDGGGGFCIDHKDPASCNADPRCFGAACGDSCDGSGFLCIDVGAPGPECPFVACCNQHPDQASCAADPGCYSTGCQVSCDPKAALDFRGCNQIGEPAPETSCPVIECQHSCALHGDETTCDADPTCFSVYTDPGTCDCTGFGCCLGFSRCADAPALCSFDGTPDCGFAPVECRSGYIPVVENGCVSGCARESSCALPD